MVWRVVGSVVVGRRKGRRGSGNMLLFYPISVLALVG